MNATNDNEGNRSDSHESESDARPSLNFIQQDGYCTPLMYAVRTGHFDIVKLLFDQAHTVCIFSETLRGMLLL